MDQEVKQKQEERFRNTENIAERHRAMVEQTETAADYLTIGQVFNTVEDSLLNFWDGYVEKSPSLAAGIEG